MKTNILLISLLLLTTACGFHLRGSQQTEFDVTNIYFQSSSAPKLTKAVKSQLSGTGSTLASSAEDASYIVTLKEEGFEKSVRSVSATTGKVEEYQITFNAKMDAMHTDGRSIVENDPISMSRDYTFDESAVLGKFSEEKTIEENLINNASSQVLRRLQALIKASKKN